jgi:hypothetical protein
VTLKLHQSQNAAVLGGRGNGSVLIFPEDFVASLCQFIDSVLIRLASGVASSRHPFLDRCFR